MHILAYQRKIFKHNPKVSPFGIALITKWQIKLGDAGTIDRFGLAFQYQITFFFYRKEWTKAIANKKYYINA